MRWCRILHRGAPVYGVCEGEHLELVRGSPFADFERTGETRPLASAKLLVPVVPANFYAVGVNFVAHIEWARARHHMQIGIPKQADIGYRSPNALIASGEDIVRPRDSEGP